MVLRVLRLYVLCIRNIYGISVSEIVTDSQLTQQRLLPQNMSILLRKTHAANPPNKPRVERSSRRQPGAVLSKPLTIWVVDQGSIGTRRRDG